ncbi:MAG: bifunctional [glutamate--ammonia ligase]-adenylyl-L-tyrosine phosphorylase/[glutamate--ammonia-ligase] adenylyltransferase [Betaproteobacteria bacterium]|nr:bifunctional [glutamate--ammonia ligase]-adenylyl-L-tyrosine phosphorylase/[glutamate--ammonia-ligase] adenylyltransferase [Betaproteobacteria bacterium]
MPDQNTTAPPSPDFSGGYALAYEQSGFARRWLPRLQATGLLMPINARITAESLSQWARQHWADELGLNGPAGEAVMPALRWFRNASLLAIMARDYACQADLDENLGAISSLACLTIDLAYRAAATELQARHGHPMNPQGQPTDLMIVGMGKLGGDELNASSDIDLIYVTDEDGLTSGRPDGGGEIESHVFFTKLGRRMAQLLGEITADGFVFRVDLRLRPNGEAGPMVCSLGMLEEYLMIQGREWERYAWVKARVVNQPFFSAPDAFQTLVDSLEDIRRPFVFRRYLDFNALAALRDLHQQIREEAKRRSQRRESRMAGEFDPVDIKLGPGGIREVEFVAQLFQLIRGGREESLQARGTREILRRLASQNRLTQTEADTLLAAYAFWRAIEHRLQYEEDAQTHVLPGNAEACARMAKAMGLADANALALAIDQHREAVVDIFDRLFRREEAQADAEGAPSGLKRTDRASRLARLEAQIEQLAQASDQPDRVRQGLQHLVQSLSKRASYLALFDEYPEALTRVSKVFAASSWAGQYLTQHPIVLDELLDARSLYEAPNIEAFGQDLQASLSTATLQGEPDIERQMDILREAHHAQVFRLLVQDLEGQWRVEELSDQLSGLADQVLAATLTSAWRVGRKIHRPDPQFAVIAYGKLGGKELGYASDLDLIFVYDDDHEMAQEQYAKLAQRINVWLTTNTASGQLFEIDLRLRPNGNAGLLVSDLQGFIDYQRQQAWVWEHQALTRARWCAGDARIGEAFEQARRDILSLPRKPLALLEEVLAMREKMHEGHPNTSGLFDLKHDRGGMVDIEFMVQVLVLRYSHQHPSLTDNIGNIALLHLSGQLGLIPTDLAAAVANAYRELRRQQHRLRLAGAASARLDLAQAPLIAQAQQDVRALWAVVFAEAPATVRRLSDLHAGA